MANRVINNYYGEIIISDKFKISKTTTKEEFISFFGEKNVSIRDMNNGYIHYFIRNINIQNSNFSFNLVFNQEQLSSITFNFDTLPTDNWDNWSEEKELKRLEKYNNWLNHQIGSKRDYQWGNIGAYFDRKGGWTSMVLRYL